MKWNFLPNAGGLYDQHPELLDEFSYIFSERSQQEEKERLKEEAKHKRESMGRRRKR